MPVGNITPRVAGYLGLRTTHTQNEIARAVFEGLALEFRVVLSKFMELTNDHYRQVTCIGGGSKNQFWVQLKADVTGRSFVINNIKENTSLGAAILAGLGAGVYRSAAQAFENLHSENIVLQPDPENLEIYQQIYEQVYCHLYEKMTGINSDIEGLLKILV